MSFTFSKLSKVDNINISYEIKTVLVCPNFPLDQVSLGSTFLWVKFPLGKISCWTNFHWVKFPLGKISCWTNFHWDKFPLGKISFFDKITFGPKLFG